MSPRATGKQGGWWLEPGGEECEFCLAAVQVEVLYYCLDCDRAVCLVCAVSSVERRRILCPECAPA